MTSQPKMADNKYIRITRSMTRKAAQQQKDALITPLEIPLAIPQRTQLMKSKLQQRDTTNLDLDFVIIPTIIIVLLLIVILKLYILIQN